MKKILERKCGKEARFEQCGFMLLEVLISILLFALGIVALVSLQARALGTTDDAQYRAEAIHLANAYMGEIWTAASGGGVVTGAMLQGRFQGQNGTGGADYTTFSGQVTGANGIPGAQPPTVTIIDLSPVFFQQGGTPFLANVQPQSIDVTISLTWIDRENGTPHNYTQTSSVGY